MTKENFKLLKKRCCLECNKNLSQEEINFLLLDLLPTFVHSSIKQRNYSIRNSENELNEDCKTEYGLECPICKENFDTLSHRIVVLPCGHIFCFECTHNTKFLEKLNCFLCREQFIREKDLFYYHIPPETTSFSEMCLSSFEGYPGYPLSCPEKIYSNLPIEAISIQENYGFCSITKHQIWLFQNREALLIKLTKEKPIQILNRWENIPEDFINSIKKQHTQSRQYSLSVRMVSQQSYSPIEEKDYDFFSSESLYSGDEFVPIQFTSLNFFSPRNTERIQETQRVLNEVIHLKDQWLIGHEIFDGEMISSERYLSIDRNSPLVFRNTFKNNGNGYYDYQKLFVCLDNHNQITKWCIYNFTLKNGKTETFCDLPYILGRHSGDSHPFRTDPRLYVHEVFHSTTNDEELINHSLLKTFAEVALEYGPFGLGYTHILDIGSAWPHNNTLNRVQRCEPSLLLYTRDENENPIGYSLSPYCHLQSHSVILGIISLTTNSENRCNYLTLGIPTNGYASSELSTIKPIIEKLQLYFHTNKELIESI